MIEEILALHFTDIKDVFQPVFDGMTNEAREEMFNIFKEGDTTQDDIDKLIDDAYDEGYELGKEEGYDEGFEDGQS